ncbi:hypothetical protein B7463_g2318, partial [Scytalidium lignicola]
MAVVPTTRYAADEEARAEVEVLNSRLEKTNQLTKKIQASLGRLESTGRSVQEAIGPIYGHTQKLQILSTNIEGILAAIEKIRQPSDIKNNEEEIIKAGPVKAGLSAFLGSLQRVSSAMMEMKKTNLRSNQQAQADLSRILKTGNTQLEAHFQILLQEDSRPVEPLHYITKDKPFPLLSQDKTTRLGRGANGIGTYAKGMEGAFLAEYDNICALFSRDEWSKVFNLTCQSAVSELARTLRELNIHIKANLTTDCYLAYEIIEIMSNLSSGLENRTGELKPSFAAALKPIRETGKSSLGELLEDTRRRVNNLQIVPQDGAPVPVTTEIVTRLQTMINFLGPISSVLISLGDGNWKPGSTSNGPIDGIPSLNSFDISADGRQIFAHYCVDTIDTLMSALEARGKLMLKSKQTLGVFIANNATIVDRIVRTSELQLLLESRMTDIEKWRKTGTQLYTIAWREPSAHLLDVQYTNRGARPTSGHASAIDSAAILKGLSTKDKDSIKEKFRLFNASFDDLLARHRTLHMEPEVKEIVARQVQQMIEPLYGRFWDRYHEIDKGKGKYANKDAKTFRFQKRIDQEEQFWPKSSAAHNGGQEVWQSAFARGRPGRAKHMRKLGQSFAEFREIFDDSAFPSIYHIYVIVRELDARMVHLTDATVEVKNNNGNSANESAVSSPERHSNRASQSDTITRQDDGQSRKKRKRGKKKLREDRSSKRRHSSISRAARDPRDEASPAEPDPGTRSPSPVIDFDGLSRPSHGTRERLDETPEQAAKRLSKLSSSVRTILECVGEDPDRQGLIGTPERYAKAMLFFTKGYQENIQDIVRGAIFHENHNEFVIVKDIEVFSLCEHHLVPFTGKMHIGYIPDKDVIGISKLPRIADMFSRRLQIQERLTKDVANAIMEVLKPQGIGVVVESSHLCMVMRGVEKTTATTITSCVLGCIEKREKTRNEFFNLIGLNRRS